MTNTDHDERLGSSAEEPREMPLPGDPNVIFLGGLFILAALGAAYLASEIVLPLVLAFILLGDISVVIVGESGRDKSTSAKPTGNARAQGVTMVGVCR